MHWRPGKTVDTDGTNTVESRPQDKPYPPAGGTSSGLQAKLARSSTRAKLERCGCCHQGEPTRNSIPPRTATPRPDILARVRAKEAAARIMCMADSAVPLPAKRRRLCNKTPAADTCYGSVSAAALGNSLSSQAAANLAACTFSAPKTGIAGGEEHRTAEQGDGKQRRSERLEGHWPVHIQRPGGG